MAQRLRGVSVCVWLRGHVPVCVQVPEESVRFFWKLELYSFESHMMWVLGPEFSLLERLQVLLTTEPSPQPSPHVQIKYKPINKSLKYGIIQV